ncbi:hypothetical protein ES703_64320 [subsurface metagenome]
MFVNSLNIKEFRGIKYCKGRIKFSNFTVIIGRNNSGKSTILEALSLLPHPEIRNEIDNERKSSFLRRLHPGSFARLLYLYAGTSILDYELKNIFLTINIDQFSFYTYLEGGIKVNPEEIASQLGTETKYLPGLVIFIPDTADILNKLEGRLEVHKEILTKKGVHINLAKILNEFVNDTYSEIVFLNPISLRKVYANDNTAYLRLGELGSGAEKVIKIMAFLEAFSPKLVIIDDFEARLHPSLVKLFLKWLKEKDWQTIISTHSIDVLYHLVDINPPDTTILQLNKSNEDILGHQILTLEQIEDILDANNDPRLLVDTLGL